MLTPAHVGEVSRCIYFKEKDRVATIGFVLIDRLIDLIVVVFLSLISIAYILDQWILAPVGVMILLVYLAFPLSLLEWFVRRLFPDKGIFKKVHELFSCMGKIGYKDRAIFLTATFLTYFILLIQAHITLSAFVSTSILKSSIGYVLILASNIIPLTVGGMGVRELVSITVFPMLGVSIEHAFSLSVMIFSLNVFIPGIYGFYLISKLEGIRKN